uniref:Uncharacterized protein n=1 Tax=Rhizophora mucronata TaxID=61149 RepID=A0A2P2NFH6_RHIMU
MHPFGCPKLWRSYGHCLIECWGLQKYLPTLFPLALVPGKE